MSEKTDKGGYYDPALYIPTAEEREEMYIRKMCLAELREETYKLELEFMEYLYNLKYTDTAIADIAGVNKSKVTSWRNKRDLKANLKSIFIQNEKFTKKDKIEAFNKKLKQLNKGNLDQIMREIDREDKRHAIQK